VKISQDNNIDGKTWERKMMADIHPIRTEADYEQALAEIDAILKRYPDGNPPDSERLEMLSILIKDYESSRLMIR
jgi:HTH-type transcriptional regulator/antitoxin HigA